MGKEAVDKSKKKCCGKYRKKDKHCTRCPLIVREQCQRKTEKEKEEKMGKDKKKCCSKKECKKKEKADKKKDKKKSKKKGKKK
jgi:hypothetical protein